MKEKKQISIICPEMNGGIISPDRELSKRELYSDKIVKH